MGHLSEFSSCLTLPPKRGYYLVGVTAADLARWAFSRHATTKEYGTCVNSGNISGSRTSKLCTSFE